jgi:ribonuclease HI
MYLLWPTELKRKYFQILLEMGERYESPEFWLVRLLHLIPKTDNPNLDQLRPIVLLETSRKSWLGMYMDRISGVFTTGGFLNPAQHGCLKKVGVDEANMGTINLYESAKELTSELYLVSWDFKRAFDRTPKPILAYGWLRKWLPYKFTEYLIKLGIGGSSYIKTPLLTKAIIQNDQVTISSQRFLQETGSPQGDNPSPLTWLCFIDILLCSLVIPKVGLTSFLTHDGLAVEQANSCFVDDLITSKGTIQGAQSDADIISAFCIMFGMELSLTKIVAQRLQWGNAHIKGQDHITIYSKGWVPHNIPLLSDGYHKTLGMIADASADSFTQFSIVKQQISTALTMCLRAPVSWDSKLAAIQISLFPKAIYASKLAAWTLAQMQECDKLFEGAFRKIANCHRTTAKSLLYMKTSSGGTQFPKFSTTCNIRKLGLLIRMDQQSQYRKHIVQSLLGRGARAQGKVIPVGHGAYIDKPLHQWWLTSLSQELAEMQIGIQINGRDSDETYYQWKVAMPNKGKLAQRTLRGDIGISTQDEADNTIVTIPLRVAQVWAVSIDSTTYIKEISGFTSHYETLEYMVWKVTEVRIGAVAAISNENNPHSVYPIGAYGTHKANYSEFFPTGCETRLLVLSDEVHDKDKLETKATIKKILQKSPKPSQPFVPDDKLINLIQEMGIGATAIMTDGGYNKSRTPVAGGSVIFKHSTNLYTCIAMTTDDPGKSVLPIELCALAIARVASAKAATDCTIYTDSEISVNYMTSVDEGRYQKSLLNYALSQKHLYGNKRIEWVRSHVEKRKKQQSTWTDAEVGNYIADKMALFQWDTSDSTTLYIQGKRITIRKVLTVPMEKFLQNLSKHNSFSLVKQKQLYLGDIMADHLLHIEYCYLRERDQFRAKRKPGIRPFWINKIPNILGDTSSTPITIREKAFRMKICYNKHWTTGNQKKYCGTALACPLCDMGLENQTHIIFNCQHTAMETVRKNISSTINSLIIKQKTKNPPLAPIIDFLRETAYNQNNTNIWTGLWTTKFNSIIEEKIKHKRYAKQFKMKQIYKLTRIYTDAAKSIYALRSKLLTNKDMTIAEEVIEAKLVSNKITNYFHVDSQPKIKNKKTKTESQGKLNEDRNPSTPIHNSTIVVDINEHNVKMPLSHFQHIPTKQQPQPSRAKEKKPGLKRNQNHRNTDSRQNNRIEDIGTDYYDLNDAKELIGREEQNLIIREAKNNKKRKQRIEEEERYNLQQIVQRLQVREQFSRQRIDQAENTLNLSSIISNNERKSESEEQPAELPMDSDQPLVWNRSGIG